MPNTQNVREFLRLAQVLQTVVEMEYPDWETKYIYIFGEGAGEGRSESLLGLSHAIRLQGIPIEWTDPDTSYEDDVMTYNNAVQLAASKWGRLTSF